MADEKTVAPKVSPVKEQLPVFLHLEPPHARFEFPGTGLGALVPEGTAYAPKDADTVRTLCRKYGVRFREAR